MQQEASEMRLDDGGAVALKPVGPEDEEFLVALYGSTRERELSQVEWGEGQRDAFVRWQFQLQRREYDARFPDAEYDVILVDGRPAGRVWVGRDETQIRLLDIALLPEFQNRGVGRLLLLRLIERARRERLPLRHMVFVLNDDAHRFYERLGFVIIEDFGAYKHMEWREGREP